MGTIIYPEKTDKTEGNVKAFPHRGLCDKGATEGKLLYIKSSFLAEGKCDHISSDVMEYAKRHLNFPHDTTSDQFFSEQQFESYRKLAECIATKMVANTPPEFSIQFLFNHLEPKMMVPL